MEPFGGCIDGRWGDIFNECKGAGDAGGNGAGKEERDKAGGCGGDTGDIISADASAIWAVSGRRSGGAGASVAGRGEQPEDFGGGGFTNSGALRGAYKGFGPVLFAEKLESRHEIKVDHAGGAAVADKRRAVAGQAEAEKATPGVAGAASPLWRAGADGRVASSLV